MIFRERAQRTLGCVKSEVAGEIERCGVGDVLRGPEGLGSSSALLAIPALFSVGSEAWVFILRRRWRP